MGVDTSICNVKWTELVPKTQYKTGKFVVEEQLWLGLTVIIFK